MENHPIESIMTTTMESIRDMVDVNTVIGDPVMTTDGSTIIPLSRVCFGFVAGGGEYGMDGAKGGQADKAGTEKAGSEQTPFAGGTGAGVSVQPMGFLVVNGEQVKMLPAQYYSPVDRVIELVPQLVYEIKKWIGKGSPNPACPDEPVAPLQ